ncbi:hypothetical protein [Komagataeibacter sp. FNDCR2]|uniref:hypothetical protein n=1 Tax=Komagataeibacter sp. FNDCR2 TaxID=2878682 RepID=UPI001E4889AE|nr:hypothetical protein [Komagataeibacter sp. FNDCR2]MCE2574742.1 hypothetical protein [Komagataeibacter sp. FNDCR2]
MLSSLFPQWMPPWAQAALVVGGLLFALVWLLVPFAVFGVKGRLDNLAVQLDELQAQLRVMAMGPGSAPPAAPVDMATPPDVPVWEPEPPARPAAPLAPEYGADAAQSDIPAYERRPNRVPPARPMATEPVRGRDERPLTPPSPRNVVRNPVAPRPDPAGQARAGDEDGVDAPSPSLSEWSRRGADAPPAPMHRPVRASVWPPERGSRTEPTLRWPPRAD